ncbi:LysR family transcriptional regulator [uncultured Cellulomonas sp.]|uniref:helix-turn-helix domain-containing protein n=1 Tax=uncultured Cellulomonas sp. TaxID=189682 RepID=UPI00345C35BE
MHYSVSTVSTQITSLSRTLGVTLFDRRRTGVELTPAGRQVVAASCAALCALARINGAAPTPGPYPGCPASERLPCLGLDACPGRPGAAAGGTAPGRTAPPAGTTSLTGTASSPTTPSPTTTSSPATASSLAAAPAGRSTR